MLGDTTKLNKRVASANMTHPKNGRVNVGHGICQCRQAGELLSGLLEQGGNGLLQHWLQGIRTKLAHHGAKLWQQGEADLNTLHSRKQTTRGEGKRTPF